MKDDGESCMINRVIRRPLHHAMILVRVVVGGLSHDPEVILSRRIRKTDFCGHTTSKQLFLN